MKTALIQLTSGADINANIAKIETMAAKAAAQGAQLIALPENAFFMQEHKGERLLSTQDEHPAVAAASKIARMQRCWLLAGSIAIKIDDSGKTVNRSLLFSDTGDVAATYDKIHLFDATLGDGEPYNESGRFIPGSHAVVATAPWGKLGMTVCYDLRFGALFRTLAKNGANIIAVPSAFTQTTGEAHWHVLLRARAIENGCFIIAPAQCGTHPGGRRTYGHSLIVDPWGKILAEAEGEEGIIIAELDMSLVEKTRSRLPSLTHDRDFEI